MCVSRICFLLRSDHKASLFHKRLLICFAFAFFHQNRLFVLLDGGPFDVTRNELIAERGTPVGTSSGFLGAGDYGDKLWTAKRIIQFKIALRNVLVGQFCRKRLKKCDNRFCLCCCENDAEHSSKPRKKSETLTDD